MFWQSTSALLVAKSATPSEGNWVGFWGNVALILPIDDDPLYRSVTGCVLEDNGHRVLDCSSGTEGIEAYQSYKPDLVITDMRMPGMDGPEVIRTIRGLDPLARIIAVSGAATFYNVNYFEMAKEVGADVIVRKLDHTDRVLVEINQVLGAASRLTAA